MGNIRGGGRFMGYRLTDPVERAQRRTSTFARNFHLRVYNFLIDKGVCLLRGKFEKMVYEFLLSEFSFGRNPKDTYIRDYIVNSCIENHQYVSETTKTIKPAKYVFTVNNKVPRRNPAFD